MKNREKRYIPKGLGTGYEYILDTHDHSPIFIHKSYNIIEICLFLNQQYEDDLLYLREIKNYVGVKSNHTFSIK